MSSFSFSSPVAGAAGPGFNAAFSSPTASVEQSTAQPSAFSFNAAFSASSSSSSSSSSTSSPTAAQKHPMPNFGRKSAKEGLDQEKARRMREEKLLQIRKDRRNDRALMLRRRCTDDEEQAIERGLDHMESPQVDVSSNGTSGQTRHLYQQHQENTQLQRAEHKNLMMQQKAAYEASLPPSVSQAKLDEMPRRIAGIHGDDPTERKDALIFFRKLLSSERQPPIELVVNSGIVPRLIQFLHVDSDEGLHFEAAWAATNIACAEVKYARFMIEHGVGPALVNLVAYSESERVREQAIWALSNISSDPETREHIFQCGALQPIIWELGIEKPPHRQLVTQPPLGTMQHISLVLSNLSHGGPSGIVPMELLKPLMNALAELIQSPDDLVYCHVVAALADLCEKGEETIQLILECGLLSRMYVLLGDAKAREHAIRAFCAIYRSTSDLHVRLIVSSRFVGSLEAIAQQIAAPDTSTDSASIYRANNLRCEICISLGRLMEVDSKYATKLINMNIVQILMTAADRGAHDLTVQVGNCLCILILHASDDNVLIHVLPAMRIFNVFLATQNPDLIHLTLSALRRIVESETIARQVEPNLFATLREHLGPLLDYPQPEISRLAERVDSMLENGEEA